MILQIWQMSDCTICNVYAPVLFQLPADICQTAISCLTDLHRLDTHLPTHNLDREPQCGRGHVVVLRVIDGPLSMNDQFVPELGGHLTVVRQLPDSRRTSLN